MVIRGICLDTWSTQLGRVPSLADIPPAGRSYILVFALGAGNRSTRLIWAALLPRTS